VPGPQGPTGPIGPQGPSITVQNDSVVITTNLQSLNFAGNGIIASNVGDAVTVTFEGVQSSIYALGNISGSFTPNRTLATVQTATLTGNINLQVPVNMDIGESLTLIFTQDGVGGRTLTANSNYKFASNYKVLSFNANSIDMLNMFYDGSRYYVALTTGYA
jgi:hypothetical protein